MARHGICAQAHTAARATISTGSVSRPWQDPQCKGSRRRTARCTLFHQHVATGEPAGLCRALDHLPSTRQPARTPRSNTRTPRLDLGWPDIHAKHSAAGVGPASTLAWYTVLGLAGIGSIEPEERLIKASPRYSHYQKLNNWS